MFQSQRLIHQATHTFWFSY